MADYSVTGNPISLSRGASSLIRVEFGLIQTAIATKVDNTGDTYTGTHDMTGATVTVATPTTATQAATKGYCDALAFATVLPDQTGNSGELVTTNGVTASWTPIKTVGGASIIGSGDIAILGSGGRTITGNLTLTVTSGVIADAAISVTPTAPGLYVTLPVATTITTEGVTQISVYNAGDYDYGVKDSAGTQLGWVRPRTGAIIGLADNTTSAGTWVPYGLEKLGITAQYLNPTGTNSGSLFRRIALDSDRTLFLFGNSTCYCIVYNSATQTWGTATTVRTGLGTNLFNGVLAATDLVLVCSCDATTGLEAVTISVSGTTPTVNTGTKVAVVLAGNIASTQLGQLIAVSTSWVLAYGRDTTTSAIRAITVSGTTPTIGAESALVPANTTAAVLFASGSIVRTVACISGASGLSCKPYTVSGSGLSAGTAASATTSDALFRAFQDGNGNIVCNYRNSNHSATIFKLTTTVEAASTAVLCATDPASAVAATDYLVISADKTLFISHETTNWYANILTGTSGTASAGTQITGVSGTITAPESIALSGTTARMSYYVSGTSIVQLTIDCSGASPSFTSSECVAHASTPGQGIPVSSDKFGIRSGKSLVAGTTKYILGGGSGFGDTVFSVGRISRQGPIPQIANTYLAGGTSKEAFCCGVVNGTVGFIIQRVECAA